MKLQFTLSGSIRFWFKNNEDFMIGFGNNSLKPTSKYTWVTNDGAIWHSNDHPCREGMAISPSHRSSIIMIETARLGFIWWTKTRRTNFGKKIEFLKYL